MPALFTSVSSRPTGRRAGAPRRARRGRPRARARRRSRAATARVFSGSRPCTITAAPRLASSSATRRPCPSVEPVTRIVCSASGLTAGAGRNTMIAPTSSSPAASWAPSATPGALVLGGVLDRREHDGRAEEEDERPEGGVAVHRRDHTRGFRKQSTLGGRMMRSTRAGGRPRRPGDRLLGDPRAAGRGVALHGGRSSAAPTRFRCSALLAWHERRRYGPLLAARPRCSRSARACASRPT